MAAGTQTNPLIVTTGEPAGIGPELCLALAETKWADQLVLVGDIDMLISLAASLGKSIQIRAYDASSPRSPGELQVLHQPLANSPVCGQPDPANAPSLLDGLRQAVAGCISGEFSALVTAPLQKSVMMEAGIPFSGHTEFLAELTDTPVPVMLLASGDLRVALASTHLPLRDVPDYLTSKGITTVLQVLHDGLVKKFRIRNPAIVVCGLNPHAGEGGHLGAEDQEIIAPAVARCVALGMNVHGPVPADTAFTRKDSQTDAILAMYHDQGLPVIKYASFGHAVNVTLGLPIIRTSVDHGTALEIAGKGIAESGSLTAAIELAATIAGQ